MKHRLPFILEATALLAAMAVTPTPAAAQIVYPGDTRVEMSDVTGPPLTSGDLLGPGTVRSFTCPVAWGVRTRSDRVGERLRSGSLPVVLASWDGQRLPESVRTDLLLLLTDARGDDEAGARLREALAPRGAVGDAAREAADGLVERLDGLLQNAGRIRPERPGHRTATQLAGAIGAYNSYIDAAPAELLASPPQALLAVQAVLSPLVIAALENEGRPASRRRGVDGLACAAPEPEILAPRPSVPTPPVERAAVVCVVAADGLRAIGAIVLASGDTVVATGGQRVPLADAYPTSIAYARDAAWFVRSDGLEIGGRRYVRFGLPMLAAPDAVLRRVGEHEGVPLFAEPGEDHIVVPVQPHCLMQEYRPEAELRPRG